MDFAELIAHKRDAKELSPDQVVALIEGYGDGSLSEGQMGALLMAIKLHGMSDGEIVALTAGLLRSGARIDLSRLPKAKVDRHSTGGVGDKVPLCVAALVAACSVAVPMIAGRGRAHVGGTLDKVEAIPGFRTGLDLAAFQKIVSEVGVCISDAPPEITPADRRIAALREATATVDSTPFIIAGILSKKLAAGIDALVLDVKVGNGSFTKTVDEGRELANALVKIGTAAGKRVGVVLSNMEQPLGRMVGHALEVREAFEVLRGKGPPDVIELTMLLATEMIRLTGAREDLARKSLGLALTSGKAVQVMERMIEAQGGDPRVVTDPERLPHTEHQVPVKCDASGYLGAIDAEAIGLLAAQLAAWRSKDRARQSDALDHATGIELVAKVGDKLTAGDPVALLHVRDPGHADALKLRVRKAFSIRAEPPEPLALVIG